MSVIWSAGWTVRRKCLVVRVPMPWQVRVAARVRAQTGQVQLARKHALCVVGASVDVLVSWWWAGRVVRVRGKERRGARSGLGE